MDKLEELTKYLKGALTNEPLSKHTTLSIGGPASLYIVVKLEEELISVIKKADELSVKYMVIGEGSDLLIGDKGFTGLVIKNEVRGMEEINGKFQVKTGTALQELVD